MILYCMRKENNVTIDKLVELDTEINVELEKIPNFHTKHIERSPLLHKYEKANQTFAYCTYTLYTQNRMKAYTSYQFNALALRNYELNEASEIKSKLEKLVKFNDQLRSSLKLVNQIYNKCKTEVEDLKKLFKIDDLPKLEEYE